MLGVTQAFMSTVERGEKRPNVEMLRKIARALDVSETYLIGDTPERVPSESRRGMSSEQILADDAAPPGLLDLIRTTAASELLSITDSELVALRSVDMPCTATRDGYIQVLLAIRSACKA